MADKKPDMLLRNSLLSILGLLRHKASDKNLEPVISVSKVIDMLKIAGIVVTYDQLANLAKDPAIQPLVSSINQNQLRLNLGDEPTPEPELPMPEPVQDENPEENPDEMMPPEEDEDSDDYLPPDEEQEEPERPYKSTVSMMARRAAKRND